MANIEAVDKSGTYGTPNVLERSIEYYYNLYVNLSTVLYRAKVSGEYVYYTGSAPVGAADIVLARVP